MSINKNIDDYANGRMGIYFPGFPDSLTGQCVSLVKWYLGEMCEVADWQAARGNAKDFGDTLVNQGLASVVDINDRKPGDIVVWKQDGGGYGHIGVLCSGDNIFEENVGVKGAPSAVYGGNTVHPSRLDQLSASWRTGSPTFYRPNGYSEVVTATRQQVIQDYIDILDRDPTNVDEGGITHYTTNGMTNDQVRADLADSAEYKTLQANKALAAVQAVPVTTPPPVHVEEVPVPTPVLVPEPTIPPVAPAPEPVPAPVDVPVVTPTPIKVNLTLAATVVAVVLNLIVALLKALNVL